ncbi:MAG: acyl-CoA dehydrogenase family protein [Acidimicrobiia bacterium]
MTTDVDLDQYRTEAARWLADNVSRRDASSYRGARGGGEESPEFIAEQRALQHKLFDAGYAGIAWPVEFGGAGLTNAHQRVFNEEASGYALPILLGVTLGMIGPTVLMYGTDEQKRAWIPKMLSGEEIWVQFLSEPGAGSDLAGVRTRATRDGDTWVINGSKVWSTGAMYSDVGMCLARTDWDVPKHRGLTWFRVPIAADGVTVRPIREINGGAEFCEEFLDDVVVPDDHAIGEINGGWPIANTLLALERGAAGGAGAGMMASRRRRLAPDLVALAREAGTEGDARVRQEIARAHINDYMHGQLAQRVVASIANGTLDMSGASMIKLGSGIYNPLRARIGMEIGGAAAIAWDTDDAEGNDTATTYLNGRIMSIAGGSNQIQRNLIGERLLGLPREPSFDTDKPFNEVLRDAQMWGE